MSKGAKSQPQAAQPPPFVTETVPVESLKPHPRNYLSHPEDQIKHLVKSISEHGLVRNIVIAKDGTILAGHGVWEAVKRIGWKEIAVLRMPLAPEDPHAIRLLIADNHIRQLGEPDDRALTELLKEIKTVDVDGLLGTGFDEMMLSSLVFTTRPVSEIASRDEAAEWAGMPEYEKGAEIAVKLVFRSDEDKFKCFKILGLPYNDKVKLTSVVWPHDGRRDAASIKFKSDEAPKAAPEGKKPPAVKKRPEKKPTAQAEAQA